MAYAPREKSTLLIPFNDQPHLFVVLNDPDEDGQCMLVMVTSVKKNRSHDATCLLEAGCHDFIKHQSYILYRRATSSPAAHISAMVEKKLYIEKAEVSDELFDAICEGLHASEETPRWAIEYAQAQGI